MTYTCDLNEKTRVELCEWPESIDLKIYSKPFEGATWQFVNGALLSNGDAKSIAIALLNMSGHKDVMKKKFSW